MFEIYKILLILFYIFLSLLSFYLKKKKKKLDKYFGKVSFNIKFLFLGIINQIGWYLIYLNSKEKDWISYA
jgi:hypothetical protein